MNPTLSQSTLSKPTLPKPTVTVIGAASTTFGPKVLRDILNFSEVGGCTFNFIDTNTERLGV